MIGMILICFKMMYYYMHQSF